MGHGAHHSGHPDQRQSGRPAVVAASRGRGVVQEPEDPAAVSLARLRLRPKGTNLTRRRGDAEEDAERPERMFSLALRLLWALKPEPEGSLDRFAEPEGGPRSQWRGLSKILADLSLASRS